MITDCTAKDLNTLLCTRIQLLNYTDYRPSIFNKSNVFISRPY